LLLDKATAHKAKSSCQFFTQKNVKTLYQPPPPPYYPDLSPPDYFLFPKLKMKLQGLHFADVAEIQKAANAELKKIQKEEFSAAFQKLYGRAKACMYAITAYFELKKKLFVFLTCLRFLKRSVPKLLDRSV
jgi:hypothetical protein